MLGVNHVAGIVIDAQDAQYDFFQDQSDKAYRKLSK